MADRLTSRERMARGKLNALKSFAKKGVLNVGNLQKAGYTTAFKSGIITASKNGTVIIVPFDSPKDARLKLLRGKPFSFKPKSV